MQSSTSFVCSATWMWIGPSPASAVTARSSSGVDRAQAVRRGADHRAVELPDGAPAFVEQPCEALGIVDEPPLALIGRAPPKPEWA